MIPALDEWRDVYLRVHRNIGGEPSAGRRLKAWATAAGYTEVEASASTWLFESPDDRGWWGGLWADRTLTSAFADHALSQGVADRGALERIARGWREWADAPDGWMLLPHGEILARG